MTQLVAANGQIERKPKFVDSYLDGVPYVLYTHVCGRLILSLDVRDIVEFHWFI